MESISSAVAYAVNQVTQVSEAQGIYALRMAKASESSAVLSLIQELPDLGTYNAQGGSSSVSAVGSRFSGQA